MNILDRMLLPIDPQRVAARQRARLQVQQLQAAQSMFRATADGQGIGEGPGKANVKRWWRPAPGDAVTDTLRDLPASRGQSRELIATNPIAAGAVQTNCDRVVGTGLALSAAPSRAILGWSEDQVREFRETVHAEFSLWADSPQCDLMGRLNFFDLQDLTLRTALGSGDAFTVLPDAEQTPSTMPYRLRLQTIEADRVGNPIGQIDGSQVAAGIEFAPNGAPRRCHVYNRHPGGLLHRQGARAGQWYEFVGPSGRRRVLHHFRQLRPEQPRGIPYLAPVIDSLKQLGRYTEAEIQAAVVSAFFTVFIETADARPAPVFAGASDGAPDPAATGEVNLGPGAVVGLATGEKASFANPNRPNTAFDPFVLAVLQQIGVGLGIPRELLVKAFNTSYSASRAALLDAWMWFRGVRTWLARSFCQPVYETWFAEAVMLGRVRAPGFFGDPLLRWAYTRAEWPGDSQGSLDPKKEVEAYVTAIDNRLMTRERAEWELWGTDWQQTYDIKRAEHDRLQRDGMLPGPKPGAAAGDRQPALDPEPVE